MQEHFSTFDDRGLDRVRPFVVRAPLIFLSQQIYFLCKSIWLLVPGVDREMDRDCVWMLRWFGVKCGVKTGSFLLSRCGCRPSASPRLDWLTNPFIRLL